MNPHIESFFGWLLRSSWQAAALAILVLAAQAIFRKKLSARWRYTLWLLVVARLALPVSPPSPLSIFNYARLDRLAGKTFSRLAETPPALPAPNPSHPGRAAVPRSPELSQSPPPNPSQVGRAAAFRSPDPSHSVSAPRIAATPPPPPAPKPVSIYDKLNWAAIGAALWLAGVLFLAARLARLNALFLRQLRAAREVSDAETTGLLEKCRRLLAVSASVRLVESGHIKSPALYGLFAPRMLLPVGLSREFTRAELRHVFLHELAHLKRRDMPVHCVTGFLHLLNWFNPVLWFAFRRMAADRELACDELALSCAGEGEKRAYGETIIKLLEQCSRRAALPGLMGILEDKTQMRRRILMIARFKPVRRWSALAGAILVALGLVALTDAQVEKARAPENPDNPSMTLTGTVLLSNGQPAAGAGVSVLCLPPGSTSVHQGNWAGVDSPMLPLPREPSGWADAAGRFSVFTPSNAIEVLAADPAGFAMVSLDVFSSNKPITLQPWGKITGTAYVALNPASRLTIVASLPVATFPGQRKVGIEFDSQTDAAGQFVFDHVPPGNVGVGFGNEGTSIRGTNIRFGSGVLQTVAVAPGTTVELNLSSSELSAAPKSASQLEMERMQAQMQAQIQARRGRRGALPDPEPPLIGTVLSADGRPAEDARVVRWGMGIGLEISNAAVWADTRNISRWATNPIIANPNRVAIADTQGYFVLPAMIDNSVNSLTQWVIATRFDGYASATADSVKASRPITLRPWGHIEGKLRFGNAPVTNALVRLEASALNLYEASAISATTDESGRFVLSNVPPERFTLFWKVQSGSSRGETGTSRPVDVRSGEITTVALGGAGRPVTGKLVASSPVAGLDWTRARITLQSIPPAARVSSFCFVPALFDDGSFRFDDVPPGTYELSATLSGGSTPGFYVNALRQTTVVPEITGGPADQALDLGAVKMNVSFPPEAARVGDTAPSLQATDLNGQPVKLADFRGKYVLVRLLGDRDGQAGSLAVAMARAYANEPRLMVMTVGPTPEAMENIARAEGLQNGAPMVYAYTGSSRFSDSQTARTMFVAPDGKLIAADLHGEEIREAVAHALGSGPTNQGLRLALDDGITGTVVLPDGKPAAGAMIGISGNGFDALGLGDDGLNRLQLSGTRLTTSSSERRQAMLGQQQIQNRPPAANAAFDRMFPPPDYTNGPIVLADAAGKFHIPAKVLGQYLFATHEKGFARLGPGRVDSPITIQLEAWGRIEGTIGGGRHAESNEAYSLSKTLPLPVYTHPYQTSTSPQGRGPSISPDQKGNFTFTNVAPGEYDVMRSGSVGNSRFSQTIAHVVVKAGAVTRLEVGDMVPPRGLLRGRSNVPSASGGSGLPVPGNPVITNTARSTNVDSQGSNTPPAAPPSSRAPSSGPSAINGTILLPNGQPAAGAQVALEVSTYNWAKLSHARLIWDQGGGIETATLPVEADKDGRFSFRPTADVLAIVAVHEQGYVRVGLQDFKNGLGIALQPWGRIEGMFRIGHQPGTDRWVELSGTNGFWGIQLDLQAFQVLTDREGKFVFTCVPPGTWNISHEPGPRWAGENVAVEASKTNRVIIGGTGRPVIGKFQIPSAVTNPPFRGARAPSRSFAEFSISEANRAEGYTVDATLYGPDRWLVAQMALDGTFRVEDVTPGTRWLLVNLTGVGGKTIATAGRKVVISEMPGGRSDEPLDLGTIEPVMVHSPQIGEAAPSLEVQTEDGKTFKLADHRGQYVLLDFEPQIGRRSQTYQSVEAAWTTFGKNDRLAMLTLVVPPTHSYMNGRYMDCPWPQSWLGDPPWYEMKPLRASFGIQCDHSIEPDPNLPVVLLVGPDGKIVGSDLRGDAIKAAVAAALEKSNAALQRAERSRMTCHRNFVLDPAELKC